MCRWLNNRKKKKERNFFWRGWSNQNFQKNISFACYQVLSLFFSSKIEEGLRLGEVKWFDDRWWVLGLNSSLPVELKLLSSVVCVLVTQSCLTLCDPMDCSPPGSSVHGILQARILGWVAIPFSRGSSPPRDRTHVPCIAGRFFTAEPLGNPPI